MSKITWRGFVQGAVLAPFGCKPAFTMAQSVAKADRFDVVVAGAGHNSLVAACYLAKAGFRCVVLEGRPTIGGTTKTAELTLSGFHHDTRSCDHHKSKIIPGCAITSFVSGFMGWSTSIPIRFTTLTSRVVERVRHVETIRTTGDSPSWCSRANNRYPL